MSKLGVILLNLGGPDGLEAVEPFLYNLFRDPEIINFPLSFLFRKGLAKIISSTRSMRVREKYEAIGGKSPITEITRKQAELLEEKLNKRMEAKVFIAMRYWHPLTGEALNLIQRENITEAVLLPLYPQFSVATTGSSFNEWQRQQAKRGDISYLKTEKIESFHDFKPYIEAIVERINEGLERFSVETKNNVNLIFSAHGTPLKLVKQGDPYSRQTEETVAKVLEIGEYRQAVSLCFQSKVGPQKWLEPSTIETVRSLAKAGTKQMLIVPISFVSDNLETLHELDIELREIAEENGVEQFEVMKGLNDSEKFIGALESLVWQTETGNSRLRKSAIAKMGF